MSTFVRINNDLVNVDALRRVHLGSKKGVMLEYLDGTRADFTGENAAAFRHYMMTRQEPTDAVAEFKQARKIERADANGYPTKGS